MADVGGEVGLGDVRGGHGGVDESARGDDGLLGLAAIAGERLLRGCPSILGLVGIMMYNTILAVNDVRMIRTLQGNSHACMGIPVQRSYNILAAYEFLTVHLLQKKKLLTFFSDSVQYK